MSNRTIIAGGALITLDGEYNDLPGGALLVLADRIAAVARDVEEFAGIDAERIDAAGGFIMPGVIDSHRHTWMALLRGLSADHSLLEFLAKAFYGIGSLVTAEDMAAATTVGALEAIDSGITSIFDICDCVNSPDHAVAAVEALRASGLRSVYAYGMQKFDFQPAGFADHGERLATARRLRTDYFAAADDMSGMGMLMSDFGTIPFADTTAEFRLADELGILSASHTAAATSSILLKGVREMNDHGLLRPGHVHIHANAFNDQEWKIIADTGGKVSTSPETEMQMGMGFPPVRAALAHGLLPGISTDIVCVGSGDLFSQMRLALQFQRTMDNDRVHRSGTMPVDIELGVHDALAWATRGSAEAIGLGDQVGSLTPGKKADIIVIKPRFDLVRSSYPAGSVVLQSTAADVDTVMINGQIRKRRGQLVGYDLNAVRSRANAALDRLQAGALGLPQLGSADIYGWFQQAERMASVNFAQAYTSQG